MSQHFNAGHRPTDCDDRCTGSALAELDQALERLRAAADYEASNADAKRIRAMAMLINELVADEDEITPFIVEN